MGYRALLKNYIRHLIRVAGTCYIDDETESEVLGRRERAELRLLAAEVEREDLRRRPMETGNLPGDPPPIPRR
jgi:hypothetical protein